MKYFIDTEFLEDGRTIDLISIGIVAEDGREYYGVSTEADYEHIFNDPWLVENVVPHLPVARKDPDQPWSARNLLRIANHEKHAWRNRQTIANEIVAFCTGGPVQFWGYYADYDWVALCQLYGRMIDLPEHFPKYCLDLKQLCLDVGNPKLPAQGTTEHNALCDARWNKQTYEFLVEQGRKRHHNEVWKLVNLVVPEDLV